MRNLLSSLTQCPTVIAPLRFTATLPGSLRSLVELRDSLEAQRRRAIDITKAGGPYPSSVFFHFGHAGHGAVEGSPIKGFRTAWKSACKAAGVPARLIHDFRRTAVRNLERAGVPRSAAMKMTGHLTESVYRRYAIVDEGMLREAAEKLSALTSKSVKFRSSLDQNTSLGHPALEQKAQTL